MKVDHTPDIDYLHGVNDTLAEVRRRLIVASKLDEPISFATVHQMLRDAADDLGANALGYDLALIPREDAP